ncbi:rab GTPase binding protein [Schizosaccharomyces japonicus yFS275]|uniref:PRA1 family protein n=1 Tax=Schizosaccharomyces japonicus (strain yFS275 / FY16936) TaxID=402676 RepID=B6JWJ1_SCHJY|nr:rab GTPase binding protein [Schizosaccharomyces japonicus yFS275]EEB05742.1 rab GTPase binding protein [Schizosaccharomyces japonicus yFS275]
MSNISSTSMNIFYDKWAELKRFRQTHLSSLRPYSEFLNVRRLSRPVNYSDAQTRVVFNLSRYSANYAVVVGLLTLNALLTNWILLLVLILGAAGTYGIRKLEGADLMIGPLVLKNSQLYTILACTMITLSFFASPIMTLMWLIGQSTVVVLAHAVLMEPPIESAFEAVEDQV